MGLKIVLIGGGSYRWTPTFATDLFLKESLQCSELVLVDINEKAALELQAYCRLISQKIGCDWQIQVSDIESALDGADIVCASISTGGLDAMHKDYHIPEEYGIYHTVADTVGPGGISRTLRNVPVFVGIARQIEKFCPEAWFIHVTNPLSQLTRAVCKTSSVKCVGLCHNFEGTMMFFADYFGVAREDIDAVSVGVNHGSWLKNITCKGKNIEDRLSLQKYVTYETGRNELVKTETIDDEIEETLGAGAMSYYLNFELFERFGLFPVGTSSHVVENFPFYCNDTETLERHRIWRKGVLPRRREGDKKLRQKVLDVLSGKIELPESKASRESFSYIVEALHTGKQCRQIVAMPNKGQVADLSADAIVETWANISKAGIFPEDSGSVPKPIAGYVQQIVEEQELTVEAAITGNHQKVIQAMAVSPMVANKDIAQELAERLLKAHKNLLPQFYGGVKHLNEIEKMKSERLYYELT